jgi:hypothetical protein
MNISNIMKKKITKIVIILLSLAISTTAFYFIFIKNPEEGVWFSENWSYRKTLFLDIPSQYYNFEQDILVEIDTETLITEGKMQNDCRDIRFVDEDNSTRLKYWIEGGCNTKKTQIWVNMRLPETAEKMLYIYYGNKLVPDGQEEWDGHFITMSFQECVNNWRLDNSFVGKTPLSSGEFGQTSIPKFNLDEILDKSNTLACSNSAHIYNVPINEKCNLDEDNILSNSLLPSFDLDNFIPINFCQSTNGYLYTNSILMIDTKTPKSWTHISEIDNKFPVGKDNLQTISLKIDESLNCKNSTLKDENGQEQYVKLNQKVLQNFIQKEPPSYYLNFIRPSTDGPMITGLIVMASKLPPMGWEVFEEINELFVQGSEDSKLVTEESDIDSQKVSLTFSQNPTTKDSLREIVTTEICLDNLKEGTIELNINPTPPPYTKVLFIKRKGANIGASIDLSNGIPKEMEPASMSTDLESDTDTKDKIQITIDDEEKKEDIIDDGEVLGAATPTTPDGLLTEGETNPTTVSDPTPEFSAIYNDPDTEDTASNYQIQVNTSSDFTGTVMWDSGKMTMSTTDEGNRCPDISYSGSTLSEGTKYYWRIKFWDSDDNESPWSSAANFSLSSTPIASELLTCGNDDPDYITDNLTFSALYTDPGNTDATYYEIEVNTASNFSGTVMWDSTKTSTTITSENRSSDFLYDGTSLSNDGTTYYVRLRFWDGTDTVSDWVTGEFTDTLKGFRFDGLNLNGIKIGEEEEPPPPAQPPL